MKTTHKKIGYCGCDKPNCRNNIKEALERRGIRNLAREGKEL